MTNDELERLKKSLLSQQKNSANEAADATVEWWKTVYYSGVGEGYKDPGDWFLHFWGRTYGGMKTEIDKTSYRAFFDAIIDYKDLQEQIADTQKKMSETTDDSYYAKLEKQLEKLNKKLKDNENIAEHNYSIWTAKIGNLNLDIPEQKDIYDKMNNLITAWEFYSGKEKQSLQDIVDDPNYVVLKNHLIGLWKQGKLTAEEFENLTDETVSGLSDFKQALADNGYNNFAEIIRAINDYFKDTVKDVDKTTSAVKDFAGAINAVKKELDDFISKQEKLSEAFKKIQLGGGLDRDELYELLSEMPELANYLQETADGWVVSAKGIDKAAEKLAKAEKEKLQERIDELSGYLEVVGELSALDRQAWASVDPSTVRDAHYDELYEKAEKIRKKLEIDPNKGWSLIVTDLADEISGLTFLMDLVDKKFNENELSLDGLKERYKDVQSEISDFNDKIKTIDSAIKTLNGDTLLSYEELNKLLDIDANLQYETHGDRYSVSIEALEELRKESYDTRNARIEDIKAVVQAEIESAQKTKKEYENELEKIGNMGVTETALKALAETTENIDGVNTQLEYLYDLLKRLDGYALEISVDSDKDNGISSKLQNQIDYYKTILSAIEIMRDKYSEAFEKEKEALENEKKALQEGKDALKEANDERQRELDLI